MKNWSMVLFSFAIIIKPEWCSRGNNKDIIYSVFCRVFFKCKKNFSANMVDVITKKLPFVMHSGIQSCCLFAL